MKLFIIAALVSVAAAARLEHLERSYLPPDHSHGQSGFGGSQPGFGGSQPGFGGSQSGFAGRQLGFGGQSGFGSPSGSGSFGSGFDSNLIDSAGAKSQGFGSAFPGATSNQYLPPDHEASGSNGQFGGSLSGFQRSQYSPQASLGRPQYSANQYGSASNGFGAQSQYQPQVRGSAGLGAAGRQYLAPKASSNYPQQAFDEQTGYHY